MGPESEDLSSPTRVIEGLGQGLGLAQIHRVRPISPSGRSAVRRASAEVDGLFAVSRAAPGGGRR